MFEATVEERVLWLTLNEVAQVDAALASDERGTDERIEAIEAAGERIRKYGAALLRGDISAASLGLRLAIDLAAALSESTEGES